MQGLIVGVVRRLRTVMQAYSPFSDSIVDLLSCRRHHHAVLFQNSNEESCGAPIVVAEQAGKAFAANHLS